MNEVLFWLGVAVFFAFMAKEEQKRQAKKRKNKVGEMMLFHREKRADLIREELHVPGDSE